MREIIGFGLVFLALIVLAVEDSRTATCHEEARFTMQGHQNFYSVCKGGLTGMETNETYLRAGAY